MWSRRLAAVLAAVLLVPALPALAGPQPGGEQWGNGQGANRSPGVGPTAPGIGWQTVLPDYGGGRAISPPVLDSLGHVLVPSRERDPSGLAYHLVALNLEDGSIAWDTEGLDGSCTPVASDDGDIFMMAEVLSGVVELARVDASDGTILERIVSDRDTFEFRACIEGGMRLSPDGTLLLPNRGGSGPRVTAFSTDGPLEVAWEFVVPATSNYASGRVVLSPDGTVGYTSWFEPDTLEFVVGAFDLSDGSEIDTERIALDADRRGEYLMFAHDGSGVLIGYAVDPFKVTRLAAAADGSLSHDWTLAFSRNPDLDESGILEYPRGDQYAVTDDHVVFRISADLVAVGLDSGQVEWEFTLESFNNSTIGVIADSNGDLFAPTFGAAALQSVSRTGEARWVTEDPNEFWGIDVQADTIGPITDKGVLIAWGSNPDNQAVVTAVVNSATRLVGVPGEPSIPITVAIQTCQYLFPENDSAAGVLLARDDVFADALAGAPLAGDVQCILYTPGGAGQALDPRTRTEIDRVLASGAPVTILGGTNAVSAEVANDLQGRGYAVTRLSGASRLETAVQIARRVRAANPGETRTALAYGWNWPDAVTGGAWAAVEGVPVLLTEADRLSPVTDAELDRLGTTSTIVFGGQAVISDAAANASPSPSRYFGRNRYATAADVAGRLWASVPGQGGAFVLTNLHHAHGWAFSLSAVPVSVRLLAPQLGVQADEYPEDTRIYLQSRGFDTAAGLIVLGDVSVISDGVVEQVSGDVGQ